MKISALPLRSLLALGAASLLHAQPSQLEHNPAVKDLGAPPAKTAAVPVVAPPVPELQLVRQFDRNGDQRLDAAERQAARAFLAQHPLTEAAQPTGRPRPQAVFPLALEPVRPGEQLSSASAADYSGRPLYDPQVVRTLFLDFEGAGWESELADFARTDVAVPARLTVDGRGYAGVGVHFLAQPATAALPAGYKRSLDLALDYTLPGQQLAGQRQLRLLAAPTDPTFLRTMLYERVAREYLPAPKTNFVRLVINGENWGVYVNVQPLDENFLRENYPHPQGALWSAAASGNLAYLGDNPEAYRGAYRLRTPEDAAAWAKLVELCRLIEQTEPGQLEAALSPHLDIDNALRFFALENALINQDGYGSSAGGYGLYLDPAGLFHLIPQDAAASFRLVQVAEYGKRARAEGRGEAGTKPPGGTGTDKSKTPDEPAKPANDRSNFPKQGGTDLAMLLSYSFVNKADSDLDGKVTHDEWLGFARAWFFAMDEDQTGQLTHDQFIAKVRLLVTPPSIADGRTRQTFGKEDAAAVLGGDLFAALDANHDGQITREEFTDQFERWFTAWLEPKAKGLTQVALQRAFNTLFSQTVFQADHTYIATRDVPKAGGGGERGGAGGRGGRGGGEGGGESRGGGGVNLGPLRLPGFGGGRGGDTRTLITFSEELDPLAGLDDATKPLLARLLAAPALRARYLDYVRDISEHWLTWAKLGPIAKEYHARIAADVLKDTHKPSSYEHFVQELDQDTTAGARDGDSAPSLKNFIEERGTYLNKDDAVGGRSGN